MLESQQSVSQPIIENPKITITLDEIPPEELESKNEIIKRIMSETFNDQNTDIPIRIIRNTIFIEFPEGTNQSNINLNLNLMGPIRANFEYNQKFLVEVDRYKNKLLNIWGKFTREKIPLIIDLSTKENVKNILIDNIYPTPFSIELPVTDNNKANLEQPNNTLFVPSSESDPLPTSPHPIQDISFAFNDLGFRGIDYDITTILNDLTNRINQKFAKQKEMIEKINLTNENYTKNFEEIETVISAFQDKLKILKKEIEDFRNDSSNSEEKIASKINEVNLKWENTIKEIVYNYPREDKDNKESSITMTLNTLVHIEQLDDDSFRKQLSILAEAYETRIESLCSRYENFIKNTNLTTANNSKAEYPDPLITITTAESTMTEIPTKTIDFSEIDLTNYEILIGKHPMAMKKVLDELELIQKDEKNLKELQKTFKGETFKIDHETFIERLSLEYATRIRTYESRPRNPFNGHLSLSSSIFQRNKGLRRAGIFRKSLETCNEKLNPTYNEKQLTLIVWALLASQDYKQLRRDVVKENGNDNDVELTKNLMKGFLPLIFSYTNSEVPSQINLCVSEIRDYVDTAEGGVIPVGLFNFLVPPEAEKLNRQLSTRPPVSQQVSFFSQLIQPFQRMFIFSKAINCHKILLLDVYGTVINKDGEYNDPLLNALKTSQSKLKYKIILCASDYKIGDEQFLKKLIYKQSLLFIRQNLISRGLKIESVLVDNSNQYEKENERHNKPHKFGSYYFDVVQPIEVYTNTNFKHSSENYKLLKNKLMQILNRQNAPYLNEFNQEVDFTAKNHEITLSPISSNTVDTDLKESMIRHIVNYYAKTGELDILLFDDNNKNIEIAEAMIGIRGAIKSHLVKFLEETGPGQENTQQRAYEDIIRQNFNHGPSVPAKASNGPLPFRL